MPTSLHKTRKIISKKRGGEVNSLHAKSRDSKRLRMAHARDIRLDKLASARSKKEEPIGTDLLNFIAFFYYYFYYFLYISFLTIYSQLTVLSTFIKS